MAIRPTNNPCGTHGGDHLTDTQKLTALLTGFPEAHQRMQDARAELIAGKVDGGSIAVVHNQMMCIYLRMMGLVSTYELRLAMASSYDPDGRTPKASQLYSEVVDLLKEFNLLMDDEDATTNSIGRSDAFGEATGLIKQLMFASSGSRRPLPWSERRLRRYRKRILRQVGNERFYDASAAVAGQDAQARLLVDMQHEIDSLKE